MRDQFDWWSTPEDRPVGTGDGIKQLNDRIETMEIMQIDLRKGQEGV